MSDKIKENHSMVFNLDGGNRILVHYVQGPRFNLLQNGRGERGGGEEGKEKRIKERKKGEKRREDRREGMGGKAGRWRAGKTEFTQYQHSRFILGE